MSRFRILHSDQTHEFSSLEEAQEFLDRLPSRGGVEILEAPEVFKQLNAPGAPLVNWNEIIAAVTRELEAETTPIHRDALLNVFKTTMDIAEKTVAAEDLEKFREARARHYKSFLLQEALVEENVCVETLYQVTEREIATGRMLPDDSLRRIAEQGMAAPHMSRAELIAAAQQPKTEKGFWGRIRGWFSVG